jgi:signal transduction histidine kinase
VTALFALVRAWWLRRTLRFRVTLVATTVTLLCLLALARLASGLLGTLLVDSADAELRTDLATATAQVEAGNMPRAGISPVRVMDRAGNPVDGGPRAALSQANLDVLESGEGVLTDSGNSRYRWLGSVVSAPDGAQLLVTAGAEILGYARAEQLAFEWALVASLLAAGAAGVATWLAVRTALRPVQRIRLAARGLAPGRRLPLPDARDELRELTEAINALLARRDEAGRRLQRFTGDAAHELRSPVASIRAQAEVAVLHPDPEQSVEVLSEVVAESERLSTLIDHLLVLSRSDSGEWPAAGRVDLTWAARDAVRRRSQDAVRVLLQAPSESCSVWAASSEVELVLDNLLRNAVRYARERITVLVLPVSGGGARLAVDDDGPGVPAEHRDRVFDRFYRVHDDRARDTGGFGLGLAMVAEVVRRRRGRVSVTESPEGGARFEVRWPGPPV